MLKDKTLLLISEDSALRYNKSFPDRERTLLFDCLVTFADQISLSYRRLKEALHENTLNESTEKTLVLRNVAEFNDAWTIVHTAHRLKGILSEITKIYEGVELEQDVIDVLSEVHKLRNLADHLTGSSISRLVKNGYPINGSLYWKGLNSENVYINGSANGSYYGHDIKSKTACKNIKAEFIDAPVTEIELLVGKYNFHITDGMFILRRYFEHLGDTIQKLHPRERGAIITGVLFGGGITLSR